jgi:transcriptional regulator with XRE-family HTH domain
MTGKELSEKLGVTAGVVSRYATGNNMPSQKRIQEIADITGVTFTECAAMYLVANIRCHYGEEVLKAVQAYGLTNSDVAAVAQIIAALKGNQ